MAPRSDPDTPLRAIRCVLLTVLIVAVAALTLSTGCTATTHTPEEPSTSTAAPATTTAPPSSYDEPAVRTLDAIVRHDFAAATTDFDEPMRQTPERLEASWDSYQEQFGAYQQHGIPQQAALGDLTVVRVPLQLEHGLGEFRVTFHPDQSIGGLYFLQPGVPL
ncbi:DUF3887 domain-containing protein [Rhodococcus opacus]|uniref:DUF3887 domain-containing protein n=1 Tax=Rhodococcus opacus TaxID=37919 RepID=UPI002235F1DB|nr:DUF3887 domain-containing protein [Rhodococcus opacus]UZG59627.1 DUF3887 domain-containing protein [Rhodococcus opacus]